MAVFTNLYVAPGWRFQPVSGFWLCGGHGGLKKSMSPAEDGCKRISIVTHCDTNAVRYYRGVILDFYDSETRKLWETGRCKILPVSLQVKGLKKLYILNAALALENLRVPPGNRLEKLRGDRAAQYSIRINDQYRICFVWSAGNARRVEIVDYH